MIADAVSGYAGVTGAAGAASCDAGSFAAVTASPGVQFSGSSSSSRDCSQPDDSFTSRSRRYVCTSRPARSAVSITVRMIAARSLPASEPAKSQLRRRNSYLTAEVISTPSISDGAMRRPLLAAVWRQVTSPTVESQLPRLFRKSRLAPRQADPEITERVVINEEREIALWRGQGDLLELPNKETAPVHVLA